MIDVLTKQPTRASTERGTPWNYKRGTPWIRSPKGAERHPNPDTKAHSRAPHQTREVRRDKRKEPHEPEHGHRGSNSDAAPKSKHIKGTP